MSLLSNESLLGIGGTTNITYSSLIH